MRPHHVALVALLYGSACVGGDDHDPVTEHLGEGALASELSLVAPDIDAHMCDVLPSGPPCSLLCDGDALREFLPPGTCAVFVCTLTDGREASVHSCHPADDQSGGYGRLSEVVRRSI